MVNYQLGKIYKIVDNTNGKIYIGSTCVPYLSTRLAGHTTHYNQFKKGLRTNLTSFQIIENGDYDIVLLENHPCDDKNELHSRERFYVDSLECVNKQKPTQTHQQYCDANRDMINTKQRISYQENIEVRRANMRQDYQDKKETRKAKQREYYHNKRKGELNEYLNQPIISI